MPGEHNLHPAEEALPTLSKLGGPSIAAGLDATSVASEWLSSFAKYAEKGDADGVSSLLINSEFSSGIFKPANADDIDKEKTSGLSVYWRDVLALTWDLRTFEGISAIKQFLADRLAGSQLSNIKLNPHFPLSLQTPFPDIAWIQLIFTFETKVGHGTGIVRLVPTRNENDETVWKAHSVFTNLDDLKGFPEKTGSLRSQEPNHGKWESARKKEVRFEDGDPTVLIIGGGHSGLHTAARLKMLGVSNLVIERNPRIGDNWRTRYEALCLHDPVWYDHFPYLPFPPSWPVYCPAKKFADWLEHYSDIMELNVWTSSTILNVTQDANTKIWSVVVKQSDGTERIFKVRHVVLAMGFKGGEPYIPTYPGTDSFKGQILHSVQHKQAEDHAGKKVFVVGSCTSAHDVCVDYVDHGIDVTMFQRGSTYVMSTKRGLPIIMSGLYEEGGPPTEVADKIGASFPNLMGAGLGHRIAKIIAYADKDTLDGLRERGFKTNMGYKDCGLLLMVWTRSGGYYMDVGGSQYIIDGKIKLKNDSEIKEFTETGLKFEDGSEVSADVVVFCTGLSDPRDSLRKIFSAEMAEQIKPIWGLDEEGEIKGCFRDLGFDGLWYIMGNMAVCRFYSKRIALQIKAMEEGLFGERYSLTE